MTLRLYLHGEAPAVAEVNEPPAYFYGETTTTQRVFVNISGVEDEPLWVDPGWVAAVGMRGPEDTLIVLQSGTQLVAKGMHPNEVVQLLAEGNDDPEG